MKFSLLSVLRDCKISGPISTILPPHNFLFWYDMNKFYLHYLAPSRPILFWHEYMCVYIYIYMYILSRVVVCFRIRTHFPLLCVCVCFSKKKKKTPPSPLAYQPFNFFIPLLLSSTRLSKSESYIRSWKVGEIVDYRIGS